MRPGFVSTLVLVVVAGTGWAADAVSVDDARIKALADVNEEVQRAAIGQLVEAGAGAIPALTAVVDREGPTDLKPALQALLGIVSREYTENQRKEVSERLVAELGNKHSVRTRREICKLLGLVGGTECVDRIYRLLIDPEVREAARCALARIPSREATQALVAGLQIADKDFCLALVNAIGERRDVAAVPALRSISAGADEQMSRAAIDALAYLPDAGALQTLMQAAKENKPGATRALLTLGKTLTEAGKEEDARQAFAAAAELKSLTAAEYSQVLHGLAWVGAAADVQTLLAVADDASKWGGLANHVRGAALQGLAVMPGQQVTDKISKAMADATGQRKLDLVGVLGQRGKMMTDAAASELAKATSAGNEEAVRVAAIEAIVAGNVEGAARSIVDALSEGNGAVQDAALRAACRMNGKAMTDALLQAFGKKELAADARVRVVQALGDHGGAEVCDALIKVSDDADVDVRAAALAVLGKVCDERGLDRLMAAVGGKAGADRDAAEQALMQMNGDAVASRIRAAYEKADESQKGVLLRVLGKQGSPENAALLLSAADSSSAEVRAAAAAGLARLADPDHESALMRMAEQGPAEVTRVAVGGLLDIAGKVEKQDKGKAAGLYSKLYGLAMTPEQTRSALAGLARTAGPEDVGMLDVVFPLLAEEGELPPEVCHAVARLAMQLPESRREEALQMLEASVMFLGKDSMVPEIVRYLWKLGSDFDPSRQEGFITKWRLAGPFKIRGEKGWNECPFADAKPDVKSKAVIDGQEFEWKQVHIASTDGVVSPVEILGAGEGVAAYGYAEISVYATQQVRLLVGSDDGVVVWLNGKRVLAVLEDRALTVDEEQVDVDLVNGVNRILVKSLNTFGGWGFCVRLTDPSGQPLFFEQKTD